MNTNRFIKYKGRLIFESDFLPTDERRLVCDIETKKEFMFTTGGKINLIQMPDKRIFIASKELLDKLEDEINHKKN
jgi:hypothetical protein